MIISYYGKKFLKKFNEVENKNLTPKEFFINIFYPLFFDNEKTLIYIKNSPFNQENPVAKKNRETPEGREIILGEFFNKIKKGKSDSSMFVGGYADGLIEATSFNLSLDYKHIIDENEIYYSWIGYALSLYFNGISFLFDNENILYDIYLGWQKYRELISEDLYKEYKGREIIKWNTHWLKYKYDEYSENGFNPFKENYDFKKHILKSTSWVKLLFYVSRKYSNEFINAYAYRIDRTNNTYGNISIQLKKIEEFRNFCVEYFGKNEFLNSSALYEKIYGTAYSMEKICEFGSIGLTALKPKLLQLEEKQHKDNNDQKDIKNLYKNIEENESIYKYYNTYLMATLNLKNIEKDVIEIAKSLYAFQSITRKNEGMHLVEKLLTSTNWNNFLKTITEMKAVCDAENLQENGEVLDKLMGLCISDESKLSNVILLVKFNFHTISLKEKAIK
jgi:hypothetical protein